MKAELVKNVTKIFQIVLVKYSLVTISKKMCAMYFRLYKNLSMGLEKSWDISFSSLQKRWEKS